MNCPRIEIKFIDPKNQRFGEAGDWFYDAEDDRMTVFVNRMSDWRSELAVAIHELCESIACLAADIDQTDVDAFDKRFHEDLHDGEAGDNPDAPYHKQHVGATAVERLTCSELGINWEQHEKNCE
jgi:hypothetical protein